MAAVGWDAEGDAFEADGRGGDVEFGGGLGVGHGAEDGDFLEGPIGEEFFRALLGEGRDAEFHAFPGDGGFVDAGSQGNIAVGHFPEQGDYGGALGCKAGRRD